MKGVRSYKCGSFHPDCAGVTVVDIGGFPHLWCPRCRVYTNLEAVAEKHDDYGVSRSSDKPLAVAKKLLKEGE